MRRRYKRELYAERVGMIKSLIPQACVGVDVIVGFPGETREDFLETYNFLNSLEVSYLHVFTYSERENTLAIEMKGSVPGAARADRSKMLHILSEKKRRSFYEEELGKTHQILFEGENKDGNIYGFSTNYVKVKAKYDPLLVNEIRAVKLASISAEGEVEIEEADEILAH